MLTIRPVIASDTSAITLLLGDSTVDGAAALGERKHIALGGGESGLVAEQDGKLTGLLQTAGAGGTFEIVAQTNDTASALIAAYRTAFDGPLTAWSKDGLWDSMLTAKGFSVDRTLFKMSAPLPNDVPRDHDLRFTNFDDSLAAAWIDANNDAFVGHNEQGGWTDRDLSSRQSLGWWDADGLRIGMRDGQIAAFCWTKVDGPGIGEIYAIGVVRRFQGAGYGGAMTNEGLRYLSEERGCHTAVLYVDAGNERAVSIYKTLGFEVRAIDRSFVSANA